MRENIFEYIKILLPKHKCVSIPSFGAFILNKENSVANAHGVSVPQCSVIFNSRLQHDDGVLVSHIQAVHDMSYEKASKELAGAIREVRSSLLIKKEVECSTLGKMTLEDGNITFVTGKEYIFPQHYGLSPVGLSTLTAINKDIVKEVKVVSLRKKLIVAASAVAVVLLLAMPSTTITDNMTMDSQQAGYLKSLLTQETTIVEKTTNPIIAPAEEMKTAKTVEATTAAVRNIPSSAPSRTERNYYIIVGGEPTVNKAEQALIRFRKNGFANAQIISSTERHRISVASFGNKKEAEQYLFKFRSENPSYQSAWLHSVRNR